MKPFLILCFLIVAIFSAKAQEIPVTQLFEEAKEHATVGDYPSAIKILEHLKDSVPQNNDYRIYLARVYGWKNDYSKAITTLAPLTKPSNFSPDAMELMVTTQLWAENYKEVIRLSDLALREQPNIFFKIQKAKALAALDLKKNALEVLKEVLTEDPDQEEALALQTAIFKTNIDHISFSYLNTSFSDPAFKPRHLAHLEYKRHLGKVPVLARLNYGNLFGLEGSLFEIDAYPKLGEKSYLYLNAGTAIDTEIFPQFKAGIEYFLSLNNGFTVSGGSKYLQFKNSEVLLLTGEFSYNTSNNLRLSYRPFLSNTQRSWSLSHTMAFKIINPVKEQFWQIDLQYGSVPYGFFTSNAFTDLTSIRLGIQYQFRLSENILVQPIFMYEYEEYLPSEFRNRFNSQLITTFRF